MADVAITGIQFTKKPAPTSVLINATVAAFNVLSPDPTVNTRSFIPANAKTEDAAKAQYIAVTGGLTGQYVIVVPIAGVALLIGDAVVQGTQYVVSTNDGKIAPKSDLVSGEYVSELFLADAANAIRMSLDVTGITIP